MALTSSAERRFRSLDQKETAVSKEDIQLIWLDENLETSPDSLRIQPILLELNPTAQFYSNLMSCMDAIKLIKSERVILIVSNTFARSVLPQISNHRTLVAVFIICSPDQWQEASMKEYEKVGRIFSDQELLIDSIQETMTLIEKQILPFSLFDQKQKLGRDLSEETASFIWHQMLIYVLKQMPQNQQSKDEMLAICRQYYRNNKIELKKIEEFRVSYSSDKATEWYTNEGFLYRLLNKALRTEDIELLYSFRFFVIDLYTALEQDNFELKSSEVLITFRGAQISREEIEKMKANEGGLVSINGFFSTSRNIAVARAFAGVSQPMAVFQAVIFEIEVDTSLSAVVFADIEKKTRIRGEAEILFTLNTVFKIKSVNFDLTLNIWKVMLIATNEGADKIQEHMTWLKQRLGEYSPVVYFGRLLIKEFAYEIGQKQLFPNYSQLASSLGKIGRLYRGKGCRDRALDCCRQALDIEESYYPGDRVHKAVMIQHIGVVHSDKGDFDTAVLHVFRALEMFKRTLAPQHPYTARCLGYIGYVYETKGELHRALDYYHQLFEMDEKCLPLGHPDRSIDLDMIVDIYKRIDGTKKALDFCLKKLSDQKHKLGETHFCIAQTLISMADVLTEESLDEALQYYKQAMSILEQSKSVNDRAISHCLASISCLYWRNNLLTV